MCINQTAEPKPVAEQRLQVRSCRRRRRRVMLQPVPRQGDGLMSACWTWLCKSTQVQLGGDPPHQGVLGAAARPSSPPSIQGAPTSAMPHVIKSHLLP